LKEPFILSATCCITSSNNSHQPLPNYY
jgi:hypothetical protein